MSGGRCCRHQDSKQEVDKTQEHGRETRDYLGERLRREACRGIGLELEQRVEKVLRRTSAIGVDEINGSQYAMHFYLEACRKNAERTVAGHEDAAAALCISQGDAVVKAELRGVAAKVCHRDRHSCTV